MSLHTKRNELKSSKLKEGTLKSKFTLMFPQNTYSIQLYYMPKGFPVVPYHLIASKKMTFPH
jgi:hypothetical protein